MADDIPTTFGEDLSFKKNVRAVAFWEALRKNCKKQAAEGNFECKLTSEEKEDFLKFKSPPGEHFKFSGPLALHFPHGGVWDTLTVDTVKKEYTRIKNALQDNLTDQEKFRPEMRRFLSPTHWSWLKGWATKDGLYVNQRGLTMGITKSRETKKIVVPEVILDPAQKTIFQQAQKSILQNVRKTLSDLLRDD